MKYCITFSPETPVCWEQVNTIIVQAKSADDAEAHLEELLVQAGYSEAIAKAVVGEKLYYTINCDDVDFYVSGE